MTVREICLYEYIDSGFELWQIPYCVQYVQVYGSTPKIVFVAYHFGVQT